MTNLRTAVAVALAMFAILGPPQRHQPAISPVIVTTPPTEMQAAVTRVRVAARSLSSDERGWIQGIYLNAAKVVERDGKDESPQIRTTAGLQAVHVAIISFVWNGVAGKEPGKNPELRDAIETAFLSTVGDDHIALSESLRRDAVGVFRAIAWAMSSVE